MSGMAEKTAIKFDKNIKSFIKFINDLDLQDKLNYIVLIVKKVVIFKIMNYIRKILYLLDADLPK